MINEFPLSSQNYLQWELLRDVYRFALDDIQGKVWFGTGVKISQTDLRGIVTDELVNRIKKS